MTTQSDNQTTTIDSYTPVQYLPPLDPAAIEKALLAGDISKMSPEVRVQFYRALCQSCGLNPLTRPFIVLKTQGGELHWYATVGAAEQLRKLHRVSTRILSRERTPDDLYVVTVQCFTPDGRQEESQGIEYVGNLKGQALGNALMKAASKALRRATLALCGLGLGLAEVESGQVVPFDPQTGAVQLPEQVADSGPEPDPSAGALLTVVGQWFRQRPAASREVIAQSVWGVGLHEMPHLGYEELRAGWARLNEGRAQLPWDAIDLPEHLAQWQEARAQQAILDVFDRSEGKPEESV
jgi:hypothetical protein